MISEPVSAIAVIVGVAVLCQWVAARANMPSVLFLLVAGMGVSVVIDPDEIFGDLLFTGVGLGVAVLLFEGGTSLHWTDLRVGRGPVIRLVTIGALITWLIGALAAGLFLDVEPDLAVLMGAILIVSGPTVVIPLLRLVRPRPPTGSVLRWEGILIDPVGAGLAIVVLDAMIEERSVVRTLLRVITTFTVGAFVGAGFGATLVIALRKRLIADHLQVPATFAFVVGSYALANELRPEAGLLAVTMLGMALANQRRAPAGHIAEFNEHLGALVLGIMFVVLGARVDLDAVVDNIVPSIGIIAVLVLIARPLAVFASTFATGLGWRDRGFMMVLCPRGVVAAAVASLFALELEHEGIDPGPLVPVVFTVVVGTVALVGLSARFAAHRLQVAEPDPNGIAFIGGGRFALELADALNELRVPTLHVGLDDDDAMTAAARGQLVYRGRIDSEDFPGTVRAVGIATAVALSGSDHLDAYASERIARVVGSANVYGLSNPDSEAGPGTAHTFAPQVVLPSDLTPQRLEDLLEGGVGFRTVEATTPVVSPTAVPAAAAQTNGDGWLTVCRVAPTGKVLFGSEPTAAPGSMLVQIGPGLAEAGQVD